MFSLRKHLHRKLSAPLIPPCLRTNPWCEANRGTYTCCLLLGNAKCIRHKHTLQQPEVLTAEASPLLPFAGTAGRHQYLPALLTGLREGGSCSLLLKKKIENKTKKTPPQHKNKPKNLLFSSSQLKSLFTRAQDTLMSCP